MQKVESVKQNNCFSRKWNLDFVEKKISFFWEEIVKEREKERERGTVCVFVYVREREYYSVCLYVR